MKVHHLNCATLCPRGGRWINGSGIPLAKARLVCHCLLIESPAGLVLVETGLGEDDVHGRRGWSYSRKLRRIGARLAPEETARAQLEQLGFRAADVQHVILTHLDLDHAGGLADFPQATVHVLLDEHDAAQARRGLSGKQRYRPETWAHGPRWALHARGQGEPWFGFEAVRELPGLPPELLLVPLPGHTPGHCGVAVEAGEGWLLHAGDAYFHADQVLEPPRCPPALKLFQLAVASDRGRFVANQGRLRELNRDPRVTVFSAHDPNEFERLRAAAGRREEARA
ncbi:MAG: MBL fold metallo-hydrolase [Planctomycetes bacterium]|nr:MBL fold metallo-hydrolase [Planctomycetota bacterium]